MDYYELLLAKKLNGGGGGKNYFDILFARFLGGGSSVTYTITNSLTNVTTSNNSASIKENRSYSAILTVAEGGTLSSVSVTMGGVDITSSAWNVSTMSINIASVTGNLVITAVATISVTCTITNDLWNVTNSNTSESIQKNSSYTATLSMPTGGTMDDVSIVMGGEDVTSTVYDSSTGNISIASVTGNIVITATATITITETITYSGTGATITTSIIDATEYDCYFEILFVEGSIRIAEGVTASSNAISIRPYLYDDSACTNQVGCYLINTQTVSSTTPTAANAPKLKFDTETLTVPKGYYCKIYCTNNQSAFISNGDFKSYMQYIANTITKKSSPRPSQSVLSNAQRSEADLSQSFEVKQIITNIYG